jgi:signal transduction histidine kinase
MPGMGLGLYICKHLVEAMGGHIWVESSGRKGEGSRFCLTLPSSLLAVAPRGLFL